MTVVSLKPGNSCSNGTVKVEFSDGSSLLLSTNYLPGDGSNEGENSAFWGTLPCGAAAGIPGWELPRELSSGEEEAFRFAAACYRAEKIALRLIARAEQSSLGLTAKLERRGFEASAANAVVSRLLDRNLLDDERYAALWVRSRLALKKAPSPRWLLAALRKRGIDRESSRKALDKALDPETEYALFLRFLESRSFREKSLLSGGERASFLRTQLKYEGFSSETLDRYFDD